MGVSTKEDQGAMRDYHGEREVASTPSGAAKSLQSDRKKPPN
jgi:hypothetical protein